MPEIRLTKNQWERISEILSNFGFLMIAATVIPTIQGQTNFLLAFLGVVATILFWYASIITAKKY